jgi:hypothetical protein
MLVQGRVIVVEDCVSIGLSPYILVLPCPCAWRPRRVKPREHHNAHHKHKVIELHTIALITGIISNLRDKTLCLSCTI